MGSRTSHLAQAQHNQELADELAKPPMKYIDWVVITLFYATVHYFEAFWAHNGWHSEDHGDRGEYVQRQFSRDIRTRKNYKSLMESGWLARYLNKDIVRTDYAVDYFNKEDIKILFSKVQEIKNALNIS